MSFDRKYCTATHCWFASRREAIEIRTCRSLFSPFEHDAVRIETEQMCSISSIFLRRRLLQVDFFLLPMTSFYLCAENNKLNTGWKTIARRWKGKVRKEMANDNCFVVQVESDQLGTMWWLKCNQHTKCLSFSFFQCHTARTSFGSFFLISIELFHFTRSSHRINRMFYSPQTIFLSQEKRKLLKDVKAK